jgi:hypothetical protein
MQVEHFEQIVSELVLHPPVLNSPLGHVAHSVQIESESPSQPSVRVSPISHSEQLLQTVFSVDVHSELFYSPFMQIKHFVQLLHPPSDLYSPAGQKHPEQIESNSPSQPPIRISPNGH